MATTSTGSRFVEEASTLAAELLREAAKLETRPERARSLELARLMTDPRGRALTFAMSDQVFRSDSASRTANQLSFLISKYGIPHYLQPWERAAMWLASSLGQVVPGLIVPEVMEHLRRKTRAVILPGDEEPLREHLLARRRAGIDLNLNMLGEAILGEEEARARLESYLQLIARPDVDYISVKISSIFSQINLLDYENTVAAIADRLRVLYRAAINANSTFVNLDMEEYRDLALTIDAFCRTLDEPEFRHYRAGIVLQAYLPDAHYYQRQLTAWAVERVASGGAPIKVRIVKGANLAMERVDASLHGWSEATFSNKPDADASYKRMVEWALDPAHAPAVHSGIASHNLFDVAWALVLRRDAGVEQFAEIEMLEGMANPQARAVLAAAGKVLLYAPVVKTQDFRSAISYLLRRLDENAAAGNFLHDLFNLKAGDATWERQREAFAQAVRRRHEISDAPRRVQNRSNERRVFDPAVDFENEADTDWSLSQNREWILPIVALWKDCTILNIPLQIGGEFLTPNAAGGGKDPNTPGRDSYRYALARPPEIEAALNAAVAARENWAGTSIEHRRALLCRAAGVLAERRGELIGVMMRDTGKSIAEGDPEVSEAIDFASYYARAFDSLTDAGHMALGTILVTPPWNFPLAIPAGGVFAALMAGNTVILKPAPESVLTAWHLANAIWDAGIPKAVLQFVPTTDDEVGKSLVTDARVSAVILTGSYETARLFKSWKPELHLIGETSGKNSMIVTALSDRDQAIKDILRSAFGHAGQKCSAASLAVLEAEVYDSAAFRNRLRDAAASLPVGEAWNPASAVTPVVREPGEALLRALTQLDAGEEWLLKPHMMKGNPCLWSPGIKLGVGRGSWFHRTECFGPVLGLMRANDLEHAIAMVNDSQFGLTSGLHSLDEREIALWKNRIEAGNLYINRGITGAIVRRQPFGGWKKSVFGAAKAGGPNYVFSLCVLRGKAVDQEAVPGQVDASNVLGESNHFRYRPARNVLIVGDGEAARQALRTAASCGVAATVFEGSEEELVRQIGKFERVRAFRPLSREIYAAAVEAHTLIIDTPLSVREFRHYMREQSVTHAHHRYGSIISEPGTQ